ncbi:alpha/beta fold hydrolase [Microbacterium trichothecenolyticum]|uniref:alpha/beta fold hydrolase n=1 Tax=Microbacterium trichothecenolyticum TaxID=69370 RepID=UPI001C6F1232|nr:alpha/beta fold hydrolase [Microbacterium trichothecenolyticum]MBW9120039.1 alpha/beta fold hydrolase [Microbacterium trichothecenolyticum]
MTVPAIFVTTPAGREGAPLLVLGPSLGTSTVLWDRVIPALAERYRVVAWDLPGHGAAPASAEPFTIGELADAVADAIDEPFLYAGVSLGGCVGLELLLRHPERVRAAAIICSGASIGEAPAWHARAAQVRAQSTSSLIIGSAQRWFAPGSIERDPDLTGRLLHALQDADDESYALCCEALAGFDVRDRLGEIGAPVLAVWGDHDGVTPEASAREIADGVRAGEAVGLTDASHLPPADAPAPLAEALLHFFDTVAAERAA